MFTFDSILDFGEDDVTQGSDQEGQMAMGKADHVEPWQQDILWLSTGFPESVTQADHFYQHPDDVLPWQVSPQFQRLPGLSQASSNDSSIDLILLKSQSSNMSNDNHQDTTHHPHHTVSHPRCLQPTQDKLIVIKGNNFHEVNTEGANRPEEKSCNKWECIRKPQIQKRMSVCKAPKPIVDQVPFRERTAPINPTYNIRKSRVINRIYTWPCRDRVIHLLALKDYSESELLIQLQKDGIKENDKKILGNILHEVANFNYQSGLYSLKHCAFKEIQKDWPGYSEIQRQSLKLILSNKAGLFNNPTSTSNFSKDITPTPEDQFLNLIANNNFMTRQLNISHSPTIIQSTSHSHLNNSTESHPPQTNNLLIPLTPTYRVTSCSSPSVCSNYNPCSTPKSPGTQDLYIPSFFQDSSIFNSQTNKRISSEMSDSLSTQNKHRKTVEKKYLFSGKKSKYKFKEYKAHRQNYNIDTMETQKAESDRQEERIRSNSSKTFQKDDAASRKNLVPPVSPDYFYNYCTILSSEQRHQYEQEFTEIYDDYYALHCKILDLTRQANDLELKRKLVSPGSKKYQRITKKILAEYQKIEDICPGWSEEYYRCSYLYHKLAHIKNLIIAFDQNT